MLLSFIPCFSFLSEARFDYKCISGVVVHVFGSFKEKSACHFYCMTCSQAFISCYAQLPFFFFFFSFHTTTVLRIAGVKELELPLAGPSAECEQTTACRL